MLGRRTLTHDLSSENIEVVKHGLIYQTTALVLTLLILKYVQFASPHTSRTKKKKKVKQTRKNILKDSEKLQIITT